MFYPKLNWCIYWFFIKKKYFCVSKINKIWKFLIEKKVKTLLK